MSMDKSGLETVLTYLTSVPAWYLATSVDGQPHVRPFSFAAIQDGRLWFCTATTKDVWEELTRNQRFEATAWWPGHGWLILRGRAGLETAPTPPCARRAGATSRGWASAMTGRMTPRSRSSASRSPRRGSATTTSGSPSSCSLRRSQSARAPSWRQSAQTPRPSR